jgi:hypothetical protein
MWYLQRQEGKDVDEIRPTRAKLALLVRDVEDWAASADSHAAHVATERLKRLYVSVTHKPHDSRDPIAAALLLVARLRPDNVTTSALLGDLDTEAEVSDELPALRRLDKLQRDHAPADWLKASCVVSPHKDEDPLVAVELWFGSHLPTLASELGQARAAQLRTPAALQEGDTLRTLLASRDRPEFAAAMGLDDLAARSLLESLRQRCQALLSDTDPLPDLVD